PNSFDFVVMSHVLEHIEDVNAEMRGLCTILKPRGTLFIEVPNGSGHHLLPFDDNISHIHFFSPTSLARLLAAHGITIVAATTSALLEPRYVDCLRVIARRFMFSNERSNVLSNHAALLGLNEIAVWGAGTLASELLANFFDVSRIAFFVDRDTTKQG